VRKTRNFRGLTSTPAIAFLALSVVMLLIASSLFIYFSVKSQQQLIAQKASDAVGGFIQEKFSILSAASSIGKMVAGNQEEQKTELKMVGLKKRLMRLEGKQAGAKSQEGRQISPSDDFFKKYRMPMSLSLGIGKML